MTEQGEGMESMESPKIRYEEVGEDKFVYCPGKNGLGKSSTLSDDLHDEWVIGEERPWWYFRL